MFEAFFEHAEACAEHAAAKGAPRVSCLEPKVLHPCNCRMFEVDGF